jgi:hypothetical protein
MEVIPTRSHTPRRDYMACTEKYQAQVRMDPDGSTENYVKQLPPPRVAYLGGALS